MRRGLQCLTIRGSFVGTREDMAESLAFAAAGKVKADYELQPLSDINEVLQRLANGQVASRVILAFTTPDANDTADRATGKRPELAGLR